MKTVLTTIQHMQQAAKKQLQQKILINFSHVVSKESFTVTQN